MARPPFDLGGPAGQVIDWLIKTFEALIDALDVRVTALEALGLTKRTTGVTNVSVTAATNGSTTVTHGLGTTPSKVLATANNDANVTNVGVSTIGATQFTVGVRFVDGVARTTTIAVGWEAIA